MKLFTVIPERIFTVLTGMKKELYAEALFVLREAFQGELVIKRKDLLVMLQSSLEASMMEADFSEEIADGLGEKESESISAKAGIMFRRLKETGWLETEYEKNSFEENVTIPDYAIQLITAMYGLTVEEQREYNGYVFATYSALKSSNENPDYRYQALSTAYRNTEKLVEELKSLFNNIKKYHAKVTDELGVNELLEEHFGDYKTQVFDTFYYPLKTIDSIPRFKTSIITMVNEWWGDEQIQEDIVNQGIQVKAYNNEDEGYEDLVEKINYIADTYENIQTLMNTIDAKHSDYTQASIEKILYLLNSDRTLKGKLIHVLQHTEEVDIMEKLVESVDVFQQQFVTEDSLSPQRQHGRRNEEKPLPVVEYLKNDQQVKTFLKELNPLYSTKKVDEYMFNLLAHRGEISISEVTIDSSEDFILTLLGTVRATEQRALYDVAFRPGEHKINGYQFPEMTFKRKGTMKCL